MNVTIPTVLTRKTLKRNEGLTYTITRLEGLPPGINVWRVETNDGVMMGDCYDLLERQAYESVLIRHGYTLKSQELSK